MLKIIFPTTCVLCDGPANRDIDLCLSCEAELPWLTHFCPRCALPLSVNSHLISCASCAKEPPLFTLTVSPFFYQTPSDYLITSLKFSHRLIYAKLLGQLLAQHIKLRYSDDSLPTHLIPVPLHFSRLQERGFNQALEIARPIAKIFNLIIDTHSFQRSRYTLPQSLLPSKNRALNIKNAFVAKKIIRTKHVAIIDDVITTGHTIKEFVQVLKLSGIERIDVWCCARTATITHY